LFKGGDTRFLICMTKTDLVDYLAAELGATKSDSKRFVDVLFEGISAALARGEKVTITGFGTFEVRSRKPRMGRNPQTGAPLHIAASKSPAFRSGKALKDMVR